MPGQDPHYWATAYPFFIPDYSYLFTGGKAVRVNADSDLPDLKNLHPVIACGSNQSPERLQRKFSDDGPPIPVIRIQLKDFDSVYGAHFAQYGSIPATLHYAPGTTVSLSVTWLTDDQFGEMNKSEAEHYHLYRLNHLSLTPEFGSPLESAFAYISRAGCLIYNDTPIALAAIAAKDRQWPELEQTDMLEHACNQIAPEHTLKTFIAEIQGCDQTRHTHADTLRRTAQLFSYQFFEKIKYALTGQLPG